MSELTGGMSDFADLLPEILNAREVCHSCHSRHSKPVSVFQKFLALEKPVIPVILVIPVISAMEEILTSLSHLPSVHFRHSCQA